MWQTEDAAVYGTPLMCDNTLKQVWLQQKKKNAIVLEGWKYKHDFKSIWSKANNVVVCCTLCAG